MTSYPVVVLMARVEWWPRESHTHLCDYLMSPLPDASCDDTWPCVLPMHNIVIPLLCTDCMYCLVEYLCIIPIYMGFVCIFHLVWVHDTHPWDHACKWLTYDVIYVPPCLCAHLFCMYPNHIWHICTCDVCPYYSLPLFRGMLTVCTSSLFSFLCLCP